MARKRKWDGFKSGNTDADGGYIVGKNKPPVANQFKPGDGRKRGQRGKGTRNLATDLSEELGHMVEVSVGGVRTKVSRQRSVVMRLADNASRGQARSIAMLLEYQQRLVEPMRVVEAERARQKDEVNCKLLTLDELLTTERILCKAMGQTVPGEPKLVPKSDDDVASLTQAKVDAGGLADVWEGGDADLP